MGNGRWKRLFWVEGRARAKPGTYGSRGNVAHGKSGQAGRDQVSDPVSPGKWEPLKGFKMRE